MYGSVLEGDVVIELDQAPAAEGEAPEAAVAWSGAAGLFTEIDKGNAAQTGTYTVQEHCDACIKGLRKIREVVPSPETLKELGHLISGMALAARSGLWRGAELAAATRDLLSKRCKDPEIGLMLCTELGGLTLQLVFDFSDASHLTPVARARRFSTIDDILSAPDSKIEDLYERLAAYSGKLRIETEDSGIAAPLPPSCGDDPAWPEATETQISDLKRVIKAIRGNIAPRLGRSGYDELLLS